MEGGFINVGGKKLWYGVFNQEKDGVPLLVVHGGPGFMTITEGFEELADQRPVYFYDQLGCGKSEKADSIDDYSIENYVEELAAVLKELHLEEVILLGHSWGGGLVTKYYLDKQPSAVKKLVLLSPLLSSKVFKECSKINIQRMPQAFQETLERCTAAMDFGDEYQGNMFAFYKKYMSSLRPFPQRLMQAFANMNEEVSGKLTGPSDLTMLGPLKDFDLMPQLPLINIPVLLAGGDTDEVTVEEMRTYQLAIPNAQLAVIPHAGHVSHLDQPAIFQLVVNTFLNQTQSS